MRNKRTWFNQLGFNSSGLSVLLLRSCSQVKRGWMFGAASLTSTKHFKINKSLQHPGVPSCSVCRRWLTWFPIDIKTAEKGGWKVCVQSWNVSQLKIATGPKRQWSKDPRTPLRSSDCRFTVFLQEFQFNQFQFLILDWTFPFFTTVQTDLNSRGVTVLWEKWQLLRIKTINLNCFEPSKKRQMQTDIRKTGSSYTS